MTNDEASKAGKRIIEELPTDTRDAFDKGLKAARRSKRKTECIDAYANDLLFAWCRSRRAGSHLRLAKNSPPPPHDDELLQARKVRDVRTFIRGKTPAEIRIASKDQHNGHCKIAGWIEVHDGKKTLGEHSSITDDIILGLLGIDIKRAVA